MSRPTDIIVVGAGIVGCAVAYELARRGASVRILDDRPPGQGATRASAGMLAPYLEADINSTLLELTVRGLNVFDDFVARVTRDSGASASYARTGSLQVATDAEGFSHLKATSTVLRLSGVQNELLDAKAARVAEPQLSEDAIGALLIPVHGYVAAGELTRSLVAAGRRYGLQVIEAGRARRVAGVGARLAIDTDRERFDADGVVLAAGSWAGLVEIEGVAARLPVKPIRGQLLRLSWNGPRIRRVMWSDRCYLVPWDDNTLLVGATVEDAGFDERTTVAGVWDLLDAVGDLVPHAWGAGFVEARAGLRPASGDELPIVGRSRVLPNLMYATGHYRNGVLLAPLTGQLVAEAMLDDSIDPIMTLLDPSRFGTF